VQNGPRWVAEVDLKKSLTGSTTMWLVGHVSRAHPGTPGHYAELFSGSVPKEIAPLCRERKPQGW